ncbi:hypothetical protein DIPPA_35182 [Diplonema papillatum]|nr:hypothetical protein DIPPA_35182 [Diplonema papillatum]
MNIFFLAWDPKTCAASHCDKHCVKMILEYVQLLYSAWYVLEGNDTGAAWKSAVPQTVPLPRLTHANHPQAKWVRRQPNNYKWLAQVGVALSDEYSQRYKKTHSWAGHAHWLSENLPNFPPPDANPTAVSVKRPLIEKTEPAAKEVQNIGNPSTLMELEAGNIFEDITSKDADSVMKMQKRARKPAKEVYYGSRNIPAELSPVPESVPEACYDEDPVAAYRKCYTSYKCSFAVWKHSKTPDWYSPDPADGVAVHASFRKDAGASPKTTSDDGMNNPEAASKKRTRKPSGKKAIRAMKAKATGTTSQPSPKKRKSAPPPPSA